jgi:ABC-type glycerol-3-phosphate transport system permease component
MALDHQRLADVIYDYQSGEPQYGMQMAATVLVTVPLIALIHFL